MAKNIEYLRKTHKYSRRKVADILGLKSDTTIQKWEAGVSAPSAVTLIELSDLFKVSLDALLRMDIENGTEVRIDYADGNVIMQLNEQDSELIKRYREAPADIQRIVCVALKLRKHRINTDSG